MLLQFLARLDQGRHPVAGGNRVVLQLPGPDDQRFVIVAGIKESGDSASLSGGIAWQLARPRQLHVVGRAKVIDHRLGQLVNGLVSARIH